MASLLGGPIIFVFSFVFFIHFFFAGDGFRTLHISYFNNELPKKFWVLYLFIVAATVTQIQIKLMLNTARQVHLVFCVQKKTPLVVNLYIHIYIIFANYLINVPTCMCNK